MVKCTFCGMELVEEDVAWSDDSVYVSSGKGVYFCNDCYKVVNREAKFEDFPEKWMMCSVCGGWFSRVNKQWAKVCYECWKKKKSTKDMFF